MFGLQSDATWIQQVDLATDSSADLIGIPLSPTETSMLEERFTTVHAAAETIDAVADNVEEYAGLWVDQASGGVIHIGLTDLDPTITSQFLAGLPPTANVVFNKVEHSAAFLNSLNDRMADLFVPNSELAQDLVRFGISYPTNALVITFLAGTPQDLIADVDAQLGTDGLVVQYEPGPVRLDSRNYTTGPLHGGQWTSNSLARNCSTGFSNAYKSPTYYMITAGHCGNGNYYQGTYTTFYTPFIGHSGTNRWVNHSTCDCLIVPEPTAKRSYSLRWIGTNVVALRGTSVSSDYYSGMDICLSGAQYADSHSGGVSCGLMDGSATIDEGETLELLDQALVVGIDAASGDSGGTYFTTVGGSERFAGIHGGTDPYSGERFFSKSTHMSSELGITLRYS